MTQIKDLSKEQFKEVLQNNLGKYIELYKDNIFVGGMTIYETDNLDTIIAAYSNDYAMLDFYIGRAYISIIVHSFEIKQ